MELKIQSIHFDATEKLQSFIAKKVKKLDSVSDNIVKVEVTLKVVKPETAMNKETSMRMTVAGSELYAEKVCDTFEEGTDLCVEALLKQLAKYKEKQRGR